MSKCVFVPVFAAGLLLGIASQASATTYQLNCTFSGPETAGICSPSASVGTITLTQNGTNSNWVDVAVHLTLPPSPAPDIVAFYLNFPSTWGFSGGNPIIGGFEYEFSVVGASPSVGANNRGPQNTVNGNCQGSPVFNCQQYAYYDVEIDPNGAALPDFNGTIKLLKKNTVSDFFPLTPATFDTLTNDSPSDNLAKTVV